MNLRHVAFLAILIAAWLPGLSMIFYIDNLFGLGNLFFGDHVAIAITKSGPVVVQDASIIGEVTPFAVAGVLVLLAPKKQDVAILVWALFCSGLGWVIYLSLSTLIGQGASGFDMMRKVIQLQGGEPADISVLQAFATGMRILYLVIGAGLLGLKVKGP